MIEIFGYNDRGDSEGHHFLVMPLMEGDLSQMMLTMTWQERLRVLHDAVCGLKALHERDFLHWDVKPQVRASPSDASWKQLTYSIAIP